jgi:GDP-L-fucose synthase
VKNLNFKNYINNKIYVAGHNGLVGSAIVRRLKYYGFSKIITVARSKLDLLDKNKVYQFLGKNKPNIVIIAAAKVGGIKSNNEDSAKFIYENLEIQNNLIHSSYLNGIKNLIFLGSSCVYPKRCRQPIKEEYLLTGPLEKTNEAYAVAKIAGIKLCEFYSKQHGVNYRSIMLCNTYGPSDNYNLETSHFFPALIKKIFLAKKNNIKNIEIWGNGKSKREVIFVDDLANAIIYFSFKKIKTSILNVGTEQEMTIEQYAKLIMKTLNVNLKINYVKKNLNGTPRKILDCSLARRFGWKSSYSLEEGLKITISDFIKNFNNYEK